MRRVWAEGGSSLSCLLTVFPLDEQFGMMDAKTSFSTVIGETSSFSRILRLASRRCSSLPPVRALRGEKHSLCKRLCRFKFFR